VRDEVLGVSASELWCRERGVAGDVIRPSFQPSVETKRRISAAAVCDMGDKAARAPRATMPR